jgi:hypothetical protein
MLLISNNQGDKANKRKNIYKSWRTLSHRKTPIEKPCFLHLAPANHHKIPAKKHAVLQDPLQKHQQKRTKKAPASAGAFFLAKPEKNLNAKARSTTAGALHRGILELKPGRLQRLHVVHRAVLQVHRRGSIHKHL